MLNLLAKGAGSSLALVLAFAAAPGVAQAALGPDAAACRGGSGQSAVLVNVSGFKSRTGSIRVNVYGSDPSKFLERGQYVRQINVPVSRSGTMPICVALPSAGRYAVAVRHDANASGSSDWNDGGGFSRNPHLSLLHLRPSFGDVAVNVGQGVLGVNVVLNYRFGLSIHPGAG